MRSDQQYGRIVEQLDLKNYLSTPKNNSLLKLYLESKFNGGFGRIIYDKTIASSRTALKKAITIRKVDSFFRKDFDLISEDEMLKFRDELNADGLKANKTMIERDITKKNVSFRIAQTERALSYRTKCDIRINFIEFYRFIMEYHYQENKAAIDSGNLKALDDITRFFRLKRPSDYNEITVNYISDDEIRTLLGAINNHVLKAMIQMSIMSGARPCEILNVRYGRKHNLYRNNDGNWVICLPQIKRVSYKKFPFVIDMFEDDLCPYLNNLSVNEGDLVFNMTEDTFRKLMLYYTGKYLGKKYSPKILRKTARMIRTNAGYSHDWINKLMGHAPGSKVQGHYLNYQGIKNEMDANDRLKSQQYPSLKRDYEKLRLEMQAQKEQMKEMMDLIIKKGVKNLKDQGLV